MFLRYQHLFSALEEALTNTKKSKPFRILEIGTFDGVRAAQMAERAIKFGRRSVEYYGFDFFEDINFEHQTEECLCSDPVRSLEDVRTQLAKNNKIVIKLFKGDSKETLPKNLTDLPTMHLIVISGGHSLITVQSDLENSLKVADENTEIVLDNYYANDLSKGCAFIVNNDLVKRKSLSVKICDDMDTNDEFNIITGIVRIKHNPGDTSSYDESIPEYVAQDSVIEGTSNDVQPVSNSVRDTNLQSAGLCGNICENSTCEHAQQCCDGSRRCESRVVGLDIPELASGQADNPQVPEERQEPDQKLELGIVESQGAADTDNGSNEQRRDISEELVSGDSDDSSKKPRRSRRTRNKRSRSQTESTDIESGEGLQDN